MKHGVVPRQLLAGPEGPTRSAAGKHRTSYRGTAGNIAATSAGNQSVGHMCHHVRGLRVRGPTL
jgi:hypothetical protein